MLIAKGVPGIRLVVVTCEGSKPGDIWPLQARVVAFKLSTHAQATDRLVLSMHNDDLALFGHPGVQHGTVLDVRWGYAGIMSIPRRFYLEEFRGFTELELIFSGHERPLTQAAKVRSWADTKVSDVVRSIASEHGFTDTAADIRDVAGAAVTIVQAGETDATLLQRLAKEHGCEFFIDADGLHWNSPQKCRAPMVLLKYNMTDSPVTDISFSSNLARHVGRVEVRGRDPLRKANIAASQNHITAPRDTLAETVEVVDPDLHKSAMQKQSSKVAVHPSPAADIETLDQESTNRFVAAESSAIRATVRMIGDPSLVARQTVSVAGVSAYLSGAYYVDEAAHTIDHDGYTTELSLMRDGAGARQGVTTAPQAGIRHDKPVPDVAHPDTIKVVDAELYETQRSPS